MHKRYSKLPSLKQLSYTLEEAMAGSITTDQGQALLAEIKDSYQWKKRFPSTNREFITLMSQLFIKINVRAVLSLYPRGKERSALILLLKNSLSYAILGP